MSADWYFMKSGWFGRSSRVGPITDSELLVKIEKGEISPDTLMQSDTKTKGRWVKMTNVPPAMVKWQQLHPTG